LTEVAPPEVLGWDRDGIDVRLSRLGLTRVSLRGRHQAENAAVADAVLEALAAAGIARVSDEARRQGYATATWPGRLGLITVDGHEVLLDGAHNPAGAAALAQAIDDLRAHLAGGSSTEPLTLVWASMADKDVEGVVAAMARAEAVRGATVVCTSVDLPRALASGALAAAWRAGLPGVHVLEAPDVAAALDLAFNGTGGPVVVAGSLYLVGAARALLVDDPALRDPAA
jgi:dihydrofolate synthase/folylpolyglutamate synthase